MTTSAPTDWDLLRSILTIRIAEERMLDLRREEEIVGSVHSCIGQESVPVGVMASLDKRDRVLSTYRGHGWALAKGVPLTAFFGELMGRATGTNGGRAGSAYLTSPDHGFVGENSIVAAGIPIANGVAMGLAAAGEGGVSVVSFGDGATNQGGAHEAIVFAIARNLPVLFVCENNSWSEMTPIVDTVPHATLLDRAAGYGLESFSADGSDVHEVVAIAAKAIAGIRAGGGPRFLEVKVPRLLGHYNADIQHYRTEADKAEHMSRDPLAIFSASLIQSGALTQHDIDVLTAQVRSEIESAVVTALAAPRPDPATARDHVVSHVEPKSLRSMPTEGRELAYGIAVNLALMTEMTERDNMVSFGEDIAIPGGTFGVTRNLRKEFGERVFDTPISETAILGAAIGSSLEGLIPVVEIMWSDFLLVAFDQIANQAANVRYISSGRVTAPLVIRMQQGITPGSCAQHSQNLEALIAHIPGIKVGLPSNAADAFAMTRAAIADADPVVLIESRALYLDKAIVDVDAPVQSVGGARLRREGGDLAIITWGGMTKVALDAADQLESENIDAAVLDLRWLAPLDELALEAVLVSAGGRAIVLHEANLTGGFGAEIVARIAERRYRAPSGAVVRIGLPDVRIPSATVLQESIMPTAAQVVEHARRLVRPVDVRRTT